MPSLSVRAVAFVAAVMLLAAGGAQSPQAQSPAPGPAVQGGYIPSGSATGLVPVTEQSTAAGVPVPNFTYHGWSSAASNNQQHNVWRASLAYVTGAHSFKVGYQAAYEVYRQIQNVDNPAELHVQQRHTHAVHDAHRSARPEQPYTLRRFYAQDQWTRGRLTLQAAVRYEHASSYFPADENGITADNRFGSRFIFPQQDGVTGCNDITPRMGAAYDLFGNGKTSVKVNISRYLETAQNGNLYTIKNPAVTFQQTTTRSWTDGNRNFIPDCNLMNPAAAIHHPASARSAERGPPVAPRVRRATAARHRGAPSLTKAYGRHAKRADAFRTAPTGPRAFLFRNEDGTGEGDISISLRTGTFLFRVDSCQIAA